MLLQLSTDVAASDHCDVLSPATAVMLQSEGKRGAA
jgi:hypothetical protein